jgi:hypothetical protein
MKMCSRAGFIRKWLGVVLVILFFVSGSFADKVTGIFLPYSSYNRIDTDEMKIGSSLFKAEFDFEYIAHTLHPGWTVYPDEQGLNKLYDYRPAGNSDSDNKWGGEFGQRLLLNYGIRPVHWFFAAVGVEFVGNYADRYWIPVNREHRLDIKDEWFDWNNAKIGIINKYFSLTYFRNYERTGWEREDDMFELFPTDDLPNNFLRYSDSYAPEYVQFRSIGEFGDVDVIYGIEALQNYKNGVYVKYKNIFGTGINLYYTDHEVKFLSPRDDKERMRNVEANRKFNVGIGELQAGVLYRPFRLGWQYQYTEDVGAGNGLDGSKYIVKEKDTEEIDALGGSLNLKIPLKDKFKFVDTLNVGAEYRGLVAGNRFKTQASVERYVSGFLSNFHLSWYYQEPLLEAMPNIISGDGRGGSTMSARAWESPFWVWWKNKTTGFDNRKTNAFSLVWTYDPTPGTWFYKNEPNEIASYNLNPNEDAAFSLAAKFNLIKYMGRLDRQLRWDNYENAVWEDLDMLGGAETKYLPSMYVLAQFVSGKAKFIYDVEFGEDVPV